MNIEEEGTPLADIMIEYGESIGEKRGEKRGEAIGKVEERKRIRKALDEIAEEHPDILLKDAYPLLQKKLDESSIDSHSKL